MRRLAAALLLLALTGRAAEHPFDGLVTLAADGAEHHVVPVVHEKEIDLAGCQRVGPVLGVVVDVVEVGDAERHDVQVHLIRTAGDPGARPRPSRLRADRRVQAVEETSRSDVPAFFDSLVGPFPYEKLALVQSTTRYGGMENASAIFFTERLGDGQRGDGLVVHEIAHQWFGDAVTERGWAHLWLSEGFATYFASLFFEFVDGEAAARRSLAESEDRLMDSFEDAQRPIIEQEPADLFQLLNANNYQKGAWVLHMLRKLIGDDAFFDGVRRYYAEFVHGTALSSDFQRVMERSSGKDLGWFFEQWLRRPGYPEVEVRAVWDNAARALELGIKQSQPWPAFRFPLRIDVEGHGFSLTRTFWVEELESRFAWSLPGRPDAVIVDPENGLLGPTKVEMETDVE